MNTHMFRNLACVSALMLIPAACSDPGSASAPKIEPIAWTDPPAYCAFLPEENAFDINDPTSWKFLFVTVPEGNGPLEESPAHMIIDGAEVMLMRDLEADGAGYRTWVYKAVNSDLEIEIKLESGASRAGAATGAMPQSGTIRVRAPKRGLTMNIVGGCGL